MTTSGGEQSVFPDVSPPVVASHGNRTTRTVGLRFFLLVSFFLLVGGFFFGRCVSSAQKASLLGGGKVGVITVEGMILDSEDFRRGLSELAEDEEVKAIVVRINSPGGGIAPSQEIYRDLMRLKEKKKIVVSMSSLAASGGYYIAVPAHAIVANPGTITGSIGVLMKFMDIQDLQKLLRVRSHSITSGPFKEMGSPTRSMRPDEEKVFQDMVMAMKGQFVQDIAKARGVEESVVLGWADGRIFTGVEAQHLGMVDELGNFQDAINLAARMVGLPEDPKVVFPPEPNRGLLRTILFGEADSEAALAGVIQRLATSALGVGALASPVLGSALDTDRFAIPLCLYTLPQTRATR